MSAWTWNTVAKQKILDDLMALLIKTMEEYTGGTANLDNYLTEFTDDNKNMDLDCPHDIDAPCCKILHSCCLPGELSQQLLW
jgi:hypothetical protein